MPKDKKIDNLPGHWVLAKMGKRVLRPGGLALTKKMLKELDIKEIDDVIEFAPGLGITAQITLSKNPKTYTGLEKNEDAVKILQNKIYGEGREIKMGDASVSGLPSDSYSCIYGEAILTMQSEIKKKLIIQEAHRLLKTGGRYGIHELGLTPDHIDENIKNTIYKSLSKAIKVDARPLTTSEWCKLFEENGFKVISTISSSMHLLEPKRILKDEGFFRLLHIIISLLIKPKERKRVALMRRTFRRHQEQLQAISFIVEKL